MEKLLAVIDSKKNKKQDKVEIRLEIKRMMIDQLDELHTRLLEAAEGEYILDNYLDIIGNILADEQEKITRL